MSKRSIRSVLACLIMFVPLTGEYCDDTGDEVSGPPRDVPVTLVNHEAPGNPSPLKILAPGEAQDCAACVLTYGGGFRTVHIQMSEEAQFLFLATRASQEVGRARCTWRGETAIAVNWTGTELQCVVWGP